MEGAGASVRLVLKAVLLSARWAGRARQPGLEQAASACGDHAEVLAEKVTLRPYGRREVHPDDVRESMALASWMPQISFGALRGSVSSRSPSCLVAALTRAGLPSPTLDASGTRWAYSGSAWRTSVKDG